jgi:hypothetical protein
MIPTESFKPVLESREHEIISAINRFMERVIVELASKIRIPRPSFSRSPRVFGKKVPSATGLFLRR